MILLTTWVDSLATDFDLELGSFTTAAAYDGGSGVECCMYVPDAVTACCNVICWVSLYDSFSVTLCVYFYTECTCIFVKWISAAFMYMKAHGPPVGEVPTRMFSDPGTGPQWLQTLLLLLLLLFLLEF